MKFSKILGIQPSYIKKAFVRNRYLPPSSGVRGAEAAKFINLVKNY